MPGRLLGRRSAEDVDSNRRWIARRIDSRAEDRSGYRQIDFERSSVAFGANPTRIPQRLDRSAGARRAVDVRCRVHDRSPDSSLLSVGLKSGRSSIGKREAFARAHAHTDGLSASS